MVHMIKKPAVCLLTALSIAGIVPSPVLAFEVITGPIEQFMDSKGNGPFGDLVRELGKRLGEETTITVVPWKRVHKTWNDGQGDSKFPIMHWSSAENGYLNTEPFYYKRMVAFVRKNHPIPANIDETRQMAAAGILGFLAPPFARQTIDNAKQKVKDEAAALRMVSAGRADYTIIELETGIAAVERLNLADKISWDANQPLWIEKVGFELRNDARGNALKPRIDAAMKAMIRDGKVPWLTDKATN